GRYTKGGDAWLITVTWADFKKLFFLQFFPRAEQERLKREYHSIRQTNTETSTEFMHTDVAQVANAARNYEILHDWDDDDAERPDKRQKSGDRHQPTSQQSSHRNYDHNNDRHGSDRNFGNGRDQRNRGQQSNRSANSGFQQSRGPSKGYSYPVCTTCGCRHPGECRRAAGTCFKYGQAGHLQKDCKKNTTAMADALSRKSGMIAGIKVEEEIIRALEQLDIKIYVRGQHGYWASLRVEPDLISRIKEAQKEDSEIWTIVENLDKQVEFRLDDDNVLWQGTRLVVPNDATLREALLTEAHSSPFSIYPGSTKMYHDLKQHFWWSGMKGDVATFVLRCLICQQVKIEHQRASGLLQPLDIPVCKWDEISMDLVTGLPRTQRRHDAIWVVVDRLTKSAHFLPIRKDYSVSRLVDIFQQEIVRLHGTPSAIVSDRDPRFASCFWKGLQKAWGTRLKKCRAPICWDQVGERVIEGPDMIEVTNEKVAVAKEKLKEARTRQKSYADKHRKSLEFQPSDHVFLKVSPARGVRRF
nr:retrotransposon protein, putative, Ty3-gypsy subclass [Tanacetum cinerariifolium]